MLLSCTAKGCSSYDHHQLDPKTNEVMCLECGEPLKNVPMPTKSVLKSLGQIQRKSEMGMQYTCKACGHSDKPLIKKLSGGVSIASCRKCGKKMDIHSAFIQAMSEMEGYSEPASANASHGTRPFPATSGATFVVAESAV